MTIDRNDRVLITGANGFVGQFLVDKLSEDGYSNLIQNTRGTIKNSGESANLDLANADSIRGFFSRYQPDHIIHLAAMARIKDGENNPDEAYKTNFLGTKMLIDLAIKSKVKSFVFVSSDLVRNHQSVVGITKYLSEGYIQNLGPTTTKFITLRIPNVSWTPGSVHLIFERLIHENKPITITHPDMSRRFISGKEAAEYIMFGLNFGNNKDIFVVTKQPEKITNLAKEMAADSGKKLNIDYIGMRPGEKLAEEGYGEGEIEHTGFVDLALLMQKDFSSRKSSEAMQMLENKPGFTLV